MDQFNPDRFHLPSGTMKPQFRQSRKLPRHKAGEKFLKGPIPWLWLIKAAKLPGRALHVGIVLWFLAGMKRSHQISLSRLQLTNLGVKRHSGYRGVEALERAGLVSVDRKRGRQAIVTLLESPKAE